MRLPTPANPFEARGRLRRLSTAALLIALALMIGRATIRENVRDTELAAPGQIAPPRDAGPATSLLIDLSLAAPALLLLARASVDRQYRVSFHLSHALFAGLAALAGLSVFWAADRFSAAVGASHLLAASTLLWTASQLFADGRTLRLLAGGAASLVLILTANGLIYRLVDVPDNLHYWREHRDEELARRGWQADSFEAQQFERKLASGEMIGFSLSPNTFAAVLVLVSIVTAGAIVQRVHDRDEIGWPIALAIPLLPTAWILTLTQSKAALTAPALAAVGLLFIGFAGRALARRRKRVYLVGILLAVMFAAAVIAYGVSRGRLPTASLAFRWNYWIAAWRLWTEQPFHGIGWTSFGLRYLQTRVPAAAEEVKDPHNLIVRAFVELGVFGGLAMLAWIGRWVWEMLFVERPVDAPPLADRRTTAWTITSISIAAFAIGVIATVDLIGTNVNAWFVLLQVLQRLLFLVLMLLGFAGVTLRSSSQAALDGRPAIWIGRAVAVAAAIFLVQNLIDFSLFEPGPMTLFAMVAGAAVAKFSRARPVSITVARFALMGFIAMILLAAVAVWLPIATAESRAAAADDAVRTNDPFTAAEHYRAAFDGLWIRNGDYAFRAAYALERAGAPANQVLTLLEMAIAADPFDTQLYRNRAGYLLHQPNPDGQRIFADFETAERLDPNEVSLHIEFADALQTLGQGVRAREERQVALRYNDLLDAAEPKRLSAERVQELRRQIERAR